MNWGIEFVRWLQRDPCPQYDELRSQVQRLEGELAQARWRPIDTAPKVRTPILYSGKNMPGERRWVTCGRYTPEGWFEINIDDSDVHGKADYPTHWMPLPDPPEPSEALASEEKTK